MERKASVNRTTKETDIAITLNLDGSGKADLSTGIGFFDHMLDGFARHGFFDLNCKVKGDLQVDSHHTVEDTGLALVTALCKALGDKGGLRRAADATVPLDEALAKAVVDISGRPYCVCSGEPDGFEYCMIGGHFTGSLVRHVMESIAMHAGICLHLHVISGRDPHHIAEAEFKALARALRFAVEPDPRIQGLIPSTKGAL